MAAPIKDVLVIGLGAVGSIYSLVLKRSGLARVTSVARSNYEFVTKNGMHIRSKQYGDIPNWKPDRLFRSIEDALDRPYSYVILTTKALPEINPTSKLLAPFLSSNYPHPQPAYLILQNGLNVERELYDAIKKLGKDDPKVIGSALWIGTNLLAEGVVEHNDFNRVTMGIYRPGSYADTTYRPGELETLEDLGNILRTGGAEVTLVPEVQRVKFKKNFWNLAFGSIATLTRYPLTAVFRDASVSSRVVPIVREILKEVLAVGRAMGFDEEALPSSVVDATIEGTARIHVRPDANHKASMLLDLETGRPLEIEVVVGEVVRKARELNVDIPRIELLYALLVVVQGQLTRNRL